MTTTHLTPEALRLARHFDRNGGWLTVTTVQGLYRAAGEQMLAGGHIVEERVGLLRVYRFTDAGLAAFLEVSK